MSLKVSPLAPAGGFPNLPAVKGVRFAAVAAGVKYEGRDDVALIEVAPGASVAGVFTRSATRSAPVLTCERHLAGLGGKVAKGTVGIIVNSGNSNAFTGRHGDGSTSAIISKTAAALNTQEGLIFPASTGVIGERLPDERITNKLGELTTSLSQDSAADAARAIMTTDTYPKGARVSVGGVGGGAVITGFAKGSGMIAPDMATMLVYIFTDASVDPLLWQDMVATACNATFNAITVDSDTSTSDTLVAVATGKGTLAIKAQSDPGYAGLMNGLLGLMQNLAHQVVRDGEGASKFVEVAVRGAADMADAQLVAKAIADSPLVKTAIAGEDPNWGRVVMAIGKSGAAADRDKISIWFGDVLVAEHGWVAESYTENAGAAHMKGTRLELVVDLGVGDGQATVWTCDLTHDYISINADYRS